MNTKENLINIRVLSENHGNHENLIVSCENPDNQESRRIPNENHEIH